MRKTLLTASLLSSALTLSGAAYAGAATTTLDVTAIVGTACSVSTSPVDFGFVDPFGGAGATGTITTTCTPGTPITIALDAGQNYVGPERAMSDSLGNLVPYQLYSPIIGFIWGDEGITIPEAAQNTISNGTDVFTVDADLPPLVDPAIDGFYSDVVTVTVTY